MLETGTGDLLRADVDALVNTVNTEGVMGKGIALQFKQAFPDNYKAYRRACDRGEVRPGKMFVVDQGGIGSRPRYIINFPTKRHWRSKSKMEDIVAGLVDLVRVIRELQIQSLALPPLGCGNGGLNWSDVEPRIREALNPLEDVRIILFPPMGAPAPGAMRIGTSRPGMTTGRASLLALMAQYGEPGTTLTKLEVQKLAYFLQAAGETLKLDFRRHLFGPYSENLNHALQRLEGHFIRGYGDRSGVAEIVVLHDAVTEARRFLEDKPDQRDRIRRVAELFYGLESPYGAELLATVHWVARENPHLAEDATAILSQVSNWSDRKRRLFNERHILIAWNKLRDQRWIGTGSVSHTSVTFTD